MKRFTAIKRVIGLKVSRARARSRPVFRPRPSWESIQSSARPPSWFGEGKERTVEERGKGKKREVKGKGMGGRGKKK